MRRARRNVAPIGGVASQPTARRAWSIGVRALIGLTLTGRQGLAMPRQGPRRQRPGKQKTRGPQKEWPRVSACIAPAFVSEETPGKKWAAGDSNPRPLRCERSALTN